MRGRDVGKVARGEQAPRPPHEFGSISENTPQASSASDATAVSFRVEDMRTAPADYRFPTNNQTRHCYARYIEYHRCMQKKEGDKADCDKFAKYYGALCPADWIVKSNEQREQGIFPGPL